MIPRLRRYVPLLAILAATIVGCTGKKGGTKSRPADVHPSMMVRPEHQAIILERISREPYASMLAEIQDKAAQAYEEDPDPAVWDSGANGRNGERAQANAFLAWLFDDAAAAEKARDFFRRLQDDFLTYQTWDINIRMPHPLMGYTNAWDLLMGTEFFPADEADAAAEKITNICSGFFLAFLETEINRLLVLGQSQNNHPIRTAAAIGYVALAFPDHPEAPKWANWAFSELDYLWGPTGHYVQPDGGVSEGPFYYGFAWGVSTAIFIALNNRHDVPPTFERDCRNRNDADPWTGHGCVAGETFTFDNPLFSPRYWAAVDWSLSLRLPSGHRPPLADAYFNPFNGNALGGAFGQDDGRYRWDWETNLDRPYEMHHGADLVAHHLVYFDDSIPAREPPYTSRFLTDAGTAVFRSDWGRDARWLLLVAENGSARKTLHDHVDGISFSLAAYGDYLLVDPGYYKPNWLDNAVTADATSHNVILIDGRGAPDKGLLTNFGDTDAFLRNIHDGAALEYAEAHQTYRDTQIERSVLFVDGRYFVVADRLTTAMVTAREHRWRLHGYAGYDSGGTFSIRADGVRVERDLGGVDVFVAASATGLAMVEPPYVEFAPPHVHEFDITRAVAHHAVVDATVDAVAPWYLAVLAPYRVGDAAGTEHGPLDVTRVDLGPNVTAWRVVQSTTTDLVLIRRSGAAESLAIPGGGTVATDAELAFVRLNGPGPLTLIARGTYLDLDGTRLAAASSGEPVVAVEP